jgi:hypothetical protein
MNKIALDYPPIRTLLDDPELAKFRKFLTSPSPEVKAFLDALDRPDVVVGMMLTPAFDVPGIVPACLALKGNKAFEMAIGKDDYLKKCLGALTKTRARSLGLAPTGRKGRVGHWMSAFTVAEVYTSTETVWSGLSFAPPLPKGASVFIAASQE